MDHSGAAGGGLLAGRYRLLDRAAAGGMGEIWRAEDTATRQRVAIKRLPPAHGERDAREVSARMLREARALVALRHPHVVEVIDAGEEPPGEPFIVLEWLEGEDLGARMRRGGMKIEDALSIAGQVCEALTAVHQAGLIHRDVKPANIFLGKADSQSTPFVKLIDFGTARHPDATRITDVGEVVGTIMYMAPEQARGETVVDARADVYALGIVLYRMITGTVPFRGSDPLAVMMKVFTEEVPSPRISKPDIDPALERVVLRATARSRSERFASAEELRQALLELDALGAATDMTQNAPIPEGVVRDIAPPVAIAERRVVTLLAAWLQASDDDLAMDAAIGVLGSFGAAATRVKGHQLLGTFGGIASGGDEPRRAVDAAFAMIERLGDHVGRIAVATRREDVLADGCAPPGALARIRVPESAGDARVVVDRETARVLRGALKGRSLSDGSVAAESLAEAGAGRHAGPLVARAAELAALSKAVAQAAQSEASIVLVVGPAGVGKTRLVRALLADQQTKPGLLIEGRGDSVRRSFPFRAIARALQRVAGIQPGQSDDERQLRLRAVIARALDLPADTTDVVGVAEVLGEAIGVRFPESPRLELARSDPEVMQRMVLASFAQVFRGAGRVGPVVLVLEDAHWIDRESISLVEQLVAQARSGARELRLPLLALVVGRHESPHDVFDILREIAASRIALRPLSRSDSMALVGGLLGSRATDALLERIVARGGGNPLFLEELALDFLARGAHDLGEDSAVPIRMELAIQQRLDRLPPEAKNATKAASVFGDVFWADSLAALGVPATNELLPMLSTRHIVSRRGTSQHDATTEWEFRHSVMREVAYSMIADAERRALHLRAAAWYAAHGGGDPATLARHYELAGASEDAGRCHAQAAERRLATDDAQRALSHLDKALAAPSLVADRVRWVLLREEALHRLGDRARQRSDLDALESLISDEDLGRERARILRRRGRFAYSVGSFDEARAKLRSATTALDMVGEREESVAALLHLVRIELLACRVEDAGRMADEIKARVRGRTSPTAVATSEHAEGLVAAARGDLERGHLAIGRALTTLAQAQVGRAREVEVRLDGAVIAARLGLTGAANDGLARVRHDAEELGDVATRGWATVHMAALALERRDVATAIELLGDATGVGLTVDDPRLIAVARRLTAVALLDRSGAGDLEAAARAADAAVVGERATGMRPRIAPALSVRARVRLRLGDLRGAAGDVVEMLETRASDGWPEEHEAELRWTEVVVRRAHGDHRSAEDVAKRAQSWLLERATSIVDPGLRRAFLEGHSLHHVILVPDATR